VGGCVGGGGGGGGGVLWGSGGGDGLLTVLIRDIPSRTQEVSRRGERGSGRMV